MGKKKKAPGYAETTYNTGDLFGSSTSGKRGITYNAPSWMTSTMGTVGNNLNSTLSNMLSGDFSNDANYQAYQNNLNRQMSQSYDANVLGQLANRGLMRTSGLQAATNAFADTLANNQMNLYDNYYNRQAQNLSNLLNTSNTLYNYITGLNNAALNNSNAVSNYNLQRFQAEQAANAANSALYGQLAQAAGTLGGGALGGPVGSAIGNKIAGIAANQIQ
jgi:hypothetical protein